MVWETFIGRFHPLLVHLPIGIFILGFFLEVAYQFGFKKLVNSRKTIVFVYALGFFFGVLAATTGWLLSLNGYYEFRPLDNHKIMGIITLMMMLVVIIVQVQIDESRSIVRMVISVVAIVLIGITGHLGGNLTHGPNYLSEYAPKPFKPQKNNVVLIDTLIPDSVQIYKDILHPLIQTKCYGCHNSENNRGGLILETYADLFKDENHEKPIVAGNLKRSALYTRITLPEKNEKVMPPRGDNFGYTNIEILKYWIENGADSLAYFESENIPESLVLLLKRDYKLDYSYRPYFEKVKVDSLNSSTLKTLRNSNFKVNYLAKNHFLLDVKFAGDSITLNDIESLKKVSSHTAFLNLESSGLTDTLINKLPIFDHLTKINIGRNKLSNSIVDYLIKHPNLESINMNETGLNSDALNKIVSLPNLLRVYVWNTKLTTEDLSVFRRTFESIEFVSQFQFEKVEEAKSVFEIENPR